jgi:O-antigen/teichoic acid export membrane protein
MTALGQAEGAKRWAARAGWSTLDVALAALASFLVQVQLARRMPGAPYGAFVTAFAAHLVVANVHGALLPEPTLVLLEQRYRDRPWGYLRALLVTQAVGSAAVLVVCLPIAAFFAPPLRGALVAAAIATPFLTLRQLLRRANYADLAPPTAAIDSFAYLLLVVVGMQVIARLGVLSVGAAYACLGVAALAVALVGILRFMRTRAQETAPPPLREVVAAHFHYARWGIPGALLAWVPLYLAYVALPVLVGGAPGLEVAGDLRALTNFVHPVLQVVGSLGVMMAPGFARTAKQGGGKVLRRFAAAVVLATLAYGPALMLIGPRVARWVYRGLYQAPSGALLVLGCVPAAFGLAAVLRSHALATNRPRDPLLGALAGAVGCAAIAGLFCPHWPLLGAAWSMLVGQAAQAATLGVLAIRARGRGASAGATSPPAQAAPPGSS